MTTHECNDFLVEIGTEELPSKSLYKLGEFFANQFAQELKNAQLTHTQITFFATPRRLALWVKDLSNKQADKTIERLGPTLALAYDSSGNPTPAAIGFAKSCQVPLESLEVKTTPKGECLSFQSTLSGQKFEALAPHLVKKALDQLPIQKPMRWGTHSSTFIRPVHWVLMLYGTEIIPGEVFELRADRKTFGHRFHHNTSLTINHPKDFNILLKQQGYVVADFVERKDNICQQITQLAMSKGQVIMNESLLDEVTGLVEWPVAMLGKFDTRFLKVPQEVLIFAMQSHQKCFSLLDSNGTILPFFIFIANIDTQDPQTIINGNEKVIHARLSDAEFFYRVDLKNNLEYSLRQLENIVFQEKLGTLYEKANRLSKMSGFIAEQIPCSVENAKRAGQLCKADLSTEMVGEFPELQGIMGYYYAKEAGESNDIAVAIKEHYQPRFSGDSIPLTPLGNCVALADKLDTLVGIFGINQPPTGEKDPFALRRLALGILRILIENQFPLDLRVLLEASAKYYPVLENSTVIQDSLTFIMERLKTAYLDKGIDIDVFTAVYARYPTCPYDFDLRIKAVSYFKKLPAANTLASANKRVNNILKSTDLAVSVKFDKTLLQLPAEKTLAQGMGDVTKRVRDLCKAYQYEEALNLLSTLREPVDQFFNEVMVMVEDESLKQNRLYLLNQLRELFLQIADISLLQ